MEILQELISPEGQTVALGLLGFALGTYDKFKQLADNENVPTWAKITEPIFEGLDRAADWSMVSVLVHNGLGHAMPELTNIVVPLFVATNGLDIMKFAYQPLSWIVNHVAVTRR